MDRRVGRSIRQPKIQEGQNGTGNKKKEDRTKGKIKGWRRRLGTRLTRIKLGRKAAQMATLEDGDAMRTM